MVRKLVQNSFLTGGQGGCVVRCIGQVNAEPRFDHGAERHGRLEYFTERGNIIPGNPPGEREHVIAENRRLIDNVHNRFYFGWGNIAGIVR